MSGDKLPPLPPGGKWEKFGGLWRATRWTGSGLNAYVGATPEERAEGAWLAWELDSGQTRVEFEQRERALVLVMAMRTGLEQCEEDGGALDPLEQSIILDEARSIASLTEPSTPTGGTDVV